MEFASMLKRKMLEKYVIHHNPLDFIHLFAIQNRS